LIFYKKIGIKMAKEIQICKEVIDKEIEGLKLLSELLDD